MDALATVLRPVASVLNRNIQATTPARELCHRLAGKLIGVRVDDTALAAYFYVGEEGIELTEATEQEPDVAISGSLLTLARMVGNSGESAIRDGQLHLTGDAETAAQFQQLLKLARPDVEEELSAVVGDVVAHRLGSIARDIGRWGKEARATMGANIREYLQEEGRDAPSRYEFDRFSKRVSTLRDDVERLEARMKRMRAID